MQGGKNAIKDKSLGRATGAYRITISFFAKYAHTYKEFGLCIYPIRELATHTLHTSIAHCPISPKKHFSKGHLMTIMLKKLGCICFRHIYTH